MEDQTDSRRTRGDVVRYWILRIVAIVLGLVVGLAWFWPGGPDVVAFLANWSTFCIQAGAIYLFVFEREFLANLVADFLDFVRRLKEYREQRAAERAAAQEAARRARTEAAKSSKATQATGESIGPAPSVAENAVRAPSEDELRSSSTKPLVKPRFTSRDDAFGPRAAVGLLFVVVIGAMFVVGSKEENPSTETQAVSQPAASTAPSSIDSSAQMHIVRGGESCWSVAENAAQVGERVETIWLLILAANPDLCSTRREGALRPGSTLIIPNSTGQ